jgi:hypothetical protein
MNRLSIAALGYRSPWHLLRKTDEAELISEIRSLPTIDLQSLSLPTVLG